MFLKVISLFILSLDACVLGSRYRFKEITLDTSFGKIHGYAREHYSRFTNVPYGLVNESNPFGDAQPHPYLKTDRQRPSNLAICPQHDQGVIIGHIQCLHLNVYKPNLITPGYTLPVMVYIHGLEFSKGSATPIMWLPEYLLRHDVIVVTVDYRLGPYGHLCLPHTEYTNQALKDQNLALRWVKNHIGSFGGDPDNILLFGQDSGSVSVEHHLLYTKEILFNKVILQSGVAASPFWKEATDIATFVRDVGLDADNIDVDRFIQTISAIDTHTVINITKLYNFRPCIDGEFIRKTPNLRNLQNTKLMIGGTANEMLYFYPREDWHDYLDLVSELNKSFSVSKMAESADAIDVVKRFYLNNTNVNIVDFASDLAFNYPLEKSVRYYVQNNCTVYRYLFSYEGHRNYMKIKNNVSAGSVHGDELGYLFELRVIAPDARETTEEDQVTTDRMSLMWTNFAKYGDPTPKTSELLPVKWTPVTAGAKRYLQIDTNLVLHNGRPFEERMAFWDSYYAKYGMYATGIRLGEGFTENRTSAVDLSKLLLLITLSALIVWQYADIVIPNHNRLVH